MANNLRMQNVLHCVAEFLDRVSDRIAVPLLTFQKSFKCLQLRMLQSFWCDKTSLCTVSMS